MNREDAVRSFAEALRQKEGAAELSPHYLARGENVVRVWEAAIEGHALDMAEVPPREADRPSAG